MQFGTKRMRDINRSVGNMAINLYVDVCIIQRLINKNIGQIKPHVTLKVDGDCGPVTTGMIIEFQRRVMNMIKPDGRVDPGKGTIQALNNILEDNKDAKNETQSNGLLLRVQHHLKAKPSDIKQHEESQSKPLNEGDYSRAASILGVDTAAIKAIAKVESKGSGFLSNGKPKILFEGHWFSRLTKSAHDAKNPTISFKKWTKKPGSC